MPYTVENGFVKIPEHEFKGLMSEIETLRMAHEDALDIAALDKALAEDEEALPGDLVKRMVEGESPVRVFRNWRGMSQQALADAASLSKTTISEIETGRKTGSVGSLARIAKVLDVDIDDLI